MHTIKFMNYVSLVSIMHSKSEGGLARKGAVSLI